MWDSFVQTLSLIFGGDDPNSTLTLWQIAARAIVVYIIGLVLVRTGKSRMVSRATPLDILLGFLLGSLLSRGITGSASISGTTVGCAAIVAMHWLFTYVAMHSHAVGKLIKGNCYTLVTDGVVDWPAMQNSHLTEQDLLEAVRLHGVADVKHVSQAHKERNGEISVVKRSATQVVEVRVQDGVQIVRIEVAG